MTKRATDNQRDNQGASQRRTSLPKPVFEGMHGYAVPRSTAPVDLHLDHNEGPLPPQRVVDAIGALTSADLRRYPSRGELEKALAERHRAAFSSASTGANGDSNVSERRRVSALTRHNIIVTNGGDETINAACRAYLDGDRNLVVAMPTFTMIPKYARLTGASVRAVRWPGESFPVDDVLEEIDESTGMVAIVSPNNPTGAVASREDISRVAKAAPHALLLVDLAYIEFADEDITADVLEHPNVLVVRTFSKAMGMAGLRIGYGIGRRGVIDNLRAASGPYPVPTPSLVAAQSMVGFEDEVVPGVVEQVRYERGQLSVLLDRMGLEPAPSQGNFVLARVKDSVWLRDAMAGMGIGIRAFPKRTGLENAVRISCPANSSQFDRLCRSLRTILEPQAILFDMDGVLADVSRSYRRAIIETAAHFGVEVVHEDIVAIKNAGDANNDWVVTQRLLGNAGVDVVFDEVKAKFEELYQGTEARSGLWREEPWMWRDEALEDLHMHYSLGIVTGRPRRDAERFLSHHGLERYFDALVCMEDAALKPSPEPVELLMEQLGISRAWLLGDTPDDIVAARGAAVLPLGIVAPGETRLEVAEALTAVGAARVIEHLDELSELLED